MMDQQQRQKVMLGALAVLGLGAGSYFVFLRDSGSNNSAQVQSGPVERKQKAAVTEAKPTRKTVDPGKRAPSEPVAVERKEREEEETTAATRKTGPKRGEKKEQKKKLAPAA